MNNVFKITIFLSSFLFISCGSPNKIYTNKVDNSDDLKPNVFLNIEKDKGENMTKLCIGDVLNIKSSQFAKEDEKNINIWLEEPPNSITSNPRNNMLPPLYRPSFKLGNVMTDTLGNIDFTFQLKDKYYPTNRNTEMIIEKGKTYILYFQYGNISGEGGSFTSKPINICN